MGRPSLLTPDTHETIVRFVRGGAYFHEACAAAGIGERTGFRWLEKGREATEAWEDQADDGVLPDLDDDPEWVYRQFWQAVSKARGEARAHAAATLYSAAVGAPARHDEDGNLLQEEVVPEWRASLAYLERTDPKNWGRTHRPTAEPEPEPEPDTEALRIQGRDLVLQAANVRKQREEAGT